ncbi:MAG: glycosyltransferase family 2 protein [Bacteroidales bacterium]|nr:glycosyltransferase family 2 protein [Bacteroidales bacterium]
MTEKKILISLVIWYRYEDTIQCIRGIQHMVKNVEYTISVVDNASPNESHSKLLQAYPDIHIVKSDENRGYAGGHTLNVMYALKNNYDAVWILNSDILIRPNSLNALVLAWQNYGDNVYGSITLKNENPDIVDFGGGISPKDSPNAFVYNLYSDSLYDDLPMMDIREVQSVEGCSMFIPIEVIRKYGFMKTDFFLYGEENDYCYRLRENGIKSFVVRNSVIMHAFSASFSMQSVDIGWIMCYYRRRNYLRFLHEHYGISRRKLLTMNDNIFAQFKFFIKYVFFRKFRRANKVNFYLLKATYHAFIGEKGRTIDPNKYVC